MGNLEVIKEQPKSHQDAIHKPSRGHLNVIKQQSRGHQGAI